MCWSMSNGWVGCCCLLSFPLQYHNNDRLMFVVDCWLINHRPKQWSIENQNSIQKRTKYRMKPMKIKNERKKAKRRRRWEVEWKAQPIDFLSFVLCLFVCLNENKKKRKESQLNLISIQSFHSSFPFPPINSIQFNSKSNEKKERETEAIENKIQTSVGNWFDWGFGWDLLRRLKGHSK